MKKKILTTAIVAATVTGLTLASAGAMATGKSKNSLSSLLSSLFQPAKVVQVKQQVAPVLTAVVGAIFGIVNHIIDHKKDLISDIKDKFDDCYDHSHGSGGNTGGNNGGNTGGNNGGNTGGNNGGGNNGVVLPQGCYMAAARSNNSFAALFGSNQLGYVINAVGSFTETTVDAVTATGTVLGSFDVLVSSADNLTLVALSTATGYEARAINVYKGPLGSFTPGKPFTYQWTGNTFTHEVEFIAPVGEIVEIVAEAVICEVGSSPNPS